MTLYELSQYFRLHEQLRRDERTLESLYERAKPGAQALTGMPHTSNVHDKVGDLAVEIASLREEITQLRAEAERAESAVDAYIATIGDEHIRIIFRLRFIRCLTWNEVAGTIGGNTEDSVKKACYRYLEKNVLACPDEM